MPASAGARPPSGSARARRPLAQVGQRGRVRLGTLGSVAGGLVGPALGAFARGHPEVECLVRAGDHERIVSLLLDGLVDLGIVTWPCAEPAAAELQDVLRFHEPVLLVARPGHPVTAGPHLGVDELVRLGRPMFRLRWWQAPHPLLTRLAEQAGTPVEIPMETARALALAGAGVGFFVRTYVAEDLARGALVEVAVRDLPPVFRDSALVRRRRGGPLSPATAALFDLLRRQAAALGVLERGRGPVTPAGRRATAPPRRASRR
jgi:DNA-binding transcriptional LysR family regulator